MLKVNVDGEVEADFEGGQTRPYLAEIGRSWTCASLQTKEFTVDRVATDSHLCALVFCMPCYERRTCMYGTSYAR